MAVKRTKHIEFEYKGALYELYFTRKTARRLEEEGFVLKDFDAKLASSVFTLFSGAFYAQHKFVKPAEKEEIFDHISKKITKNGDDEEGETLAQRLLALYSETISSLFDDEESEDSENLITWS